VAPEPGGSSPHSQQPANGPFSEPGESTLHPFPPANLPKVHFDLILPSTPYTHTIVYTYYSIFRILQRQTHLWCYHFHALASPSLGTSETVQFERLRVYLYHMEIRLHGA
jgi:hypothetical protein